MNGQAFNWGKQESQFDALRASSMRYKPWSLSDHCNRTMDHSIWNLWLTKGQVATFTPRTLVYPCQCHSTNAANTYLPNFCIADA